MSNHNGTSGIVAGQPRGDAVATALVSLIVGGAIAILLGIYGRMHDPTGVAVRVPGFSSPQTVKVWMATAVAFLAVLQLCSALVMHGRVPVTVRPGRIAAVHRWSGRAAFIVSVPVAVHCLYALGFQATDARVVTHSLIGCLFYGAFTTKMLLLAKPGVAGWTLPIVGGLVFSCAIGLFFTSALWFFVTFGIKL